MVSSTELLWEQLIEMVTQIYIYINIGKKKAGHECLS